MNQYYNEEEIIDQIRYLFRKNIINNLNYYIYSNEDNNDSNNANNSNNAIDSKGHNNNNLTHQIYISKKELVFDIFNELPINEQYMIYTEYYN